jgi:uncharacterized protein YpuA (DUF1002 family)
LRVSGSIALSGVAEKMESALETWFADNKKRRSKARLYGTIIKNLKILEN